MFKMLLTLLFAVICVSECSVLNTGPYNPMDKFEYQNYELLRTADETINLGPHVMDFLKLMDVEKMAKVAMEYMSDPEVMMFMKFVFSPEFKKVIWDFEMMQEFKEATVFLASKGYDVESIINFVNVALNLPPFGKSNFVLRNGKGISGFFDAMVDTLPLEDMKELFESKLQTAPEVADLFEIINSQEFMDIMKRMRENPKFTEIKEVFEGYGVDFKFLCKSMKEIFGDYYQGVFCE